MSREHNHTHTYTLAWDTIMNSNEQLPALEKKENAKKKKKKKDDDNKGQREILALQWAGKVSISRA